MRRDFLVSTMLTLASTISILLVAVNTRPDIEAALLPTPKEFNVREEPTPALEGGTPAGHARIEMAIRRFADAGLELPPLRIVFRSSTVDCDGAHGLFNPSPEPWLITICSDHMDWVYEHELAHAWERATLTDVQRRDFVAFRGLTTWSDKDRKWNGRGVEWVAVVIQQGLAGMSLPPALSDEAVSRLEGYEMLTGEIAPRLAEWLSLHEVSCMDRPTQLSLEVPDISGRVCEDGSPPDSSAKHRVRWADALS